MSVMDLVQREARPAYVRFERVAVEDKAASLAAGQYVAKDVDYALVTPMGSKDVFKAKVSDWLANMRQESQNGRLPESWLTHYQAAYRAWQEGQTLPVQGTPVRGWGVISPAQQETLIQLHVLTVEDVAAMNDEALTRIGMGAGELRTKARAWLSQMQDKGPLTMEVTALRTENATLKTSVETLTQQVQALLARMPSGAVERPAAVEAGPSEESEAETPVRTPRSRRAKSVETLV